MSSDDGWVLRSNKAGDFVLQHYCASADAFPDVEQEGALKFDSLADAMHAYQKLEDESYPSEYGLTVHIDDNKKAVTMTPEKYIRKPFPVDAVQVTEENVAEVAEWCGGDIRTEDDGTKFIKVRVQNPLNPKQSQAYLGDWVLYAGKGYKVYTNKAFGRSFELDNNPSITANPESYNVFEQPVTDTVGPTVVR